jgi:hypothetical protein
MMAIDPQAEYRQKEMLLKELEEMRGRSSAGNAACENDNPPSLGRSLERLDKLTSITGEMLERILEQMDLGPFPEKTSEGKNTPTSDLASRLIGRVDGLCEKVSRQQSILQDLIRFVDRLR